MNYSLTSLLEELIEKYYDEHDDEWVDVSLWDTADLVDLEVLTNGTLQARGEDDGNYTVN